MSKINVLDFSVANLIAAGEVVDRPASAVKEMLENALDAGAHNILVEIKNGGISYIKVSDDGSGISEEDLPVAIRRHATSKIKTAEDLDSIFTLGFRGEALAAIASVSKMKIISKTSSDPIGHVLVSDYGMNIHVEEMGCHEGTTVIVEELFSNTPARRKFLKRDITEGMAVAAVVEKIALSRPDVAVTLISDGVTKIETVGDGKLLNTIYSVLSRDFAKKIIHVQDGSDGLKIEGYIGSPENVRGNRNYQNFFINGRYIKSNTISSAFEEAFYSFIPTEKFPCGVLNININPSLVDVNVHPTKLEVKFSDDKLIFGLVYGAVKNALIEEMRRPEIKHEAAEMKTDYSVGQFVPVEERKDRQKEKTIEFFSDEYIAPVAPKIPRYGSDTFAKTDEMHSSFSAREEKITYTPAVESEKTNVIGYSDDKIEMILEEVSKPEAEEKPAETIISWEESELEKSPEEEKAAPYHRMVGCLFDAFVVMETEDKAVVIDKHAAHERIIFEQMRENMRNASISSQTLLIPYDFYANDEEIEVLRENKEEIEKIGIDFSLSQGKVTLNAYPSVLDPDMTVSMLQSLAQSLGEGCGSIEHEREKAFEKCLFQASCKAAMKAGIKDTEENLNWLCDQMIKYDCVKYCPHGRPVAFDISKKEIEKLFKRT